MSENCVGVRFHSRIDVINGLWSNYFNSTFVLRFWSSKFFALVSKLVLKIVKNHHY